MTSEGRRLHVAAVGASAVSSLRGLALPLIVLTFAGGGGLGRILLLGASGVVVSALLAVSTWLTTRWYLDEGTVRLRRSFLGESVTAIPLERVQAVDTVRGPIQRLFGAVELHVQAAGGGKAGEIVLKAVSPADAELLREAVRRADGDVGAAPAPLEAPERPGAAAAAPAGPQAEWRLSRGQLLVAAVTSGSLGVLLPVIAGASQVADDVLGRAQAERLVPRTLMDLALLGGGVLLLAWVLSVLGTIVAFAGFAARREGGRLRISRGIVERREASVPVGRVHAVRVIESPLREPFGLAQVRIETAGYANEAASAQTLLPLVRRRDVRRVLGELLPELAADLDDLERLPARAARRYAAPPTLLAAVLALAAVLVVGPAGLAALALVAGAVALGLARHRTAGWRLTDDRLVLRRRRLARTTATADPRRLQLVGTRATPLQRRGRLATLGVDVSSGRHLALAHLDAATADALRDRLAARAALPA